MEKMLYKVQIVTLSDYDEPNDGTIYERKVWATTAEQAIYYAKNSVLDDIRGNYYSGEMHYKKLDVIRLKKLNPNKSKKCRFY